LLQRYNSITGAAPVGSVLSRRETAGDPKAMKLVLLSDIHIGSKKAVPGRTPIDCLHAAVRHVLDKNADADLCILLGDLTETGSDAEYAALKAAIAPLPMPCRMIIGNHDEREAFKRAFPDSPVDAGGFAQQAFDAGAFRFLLLDTYWPGNGGGILDGGRLAWLDEQLAASDKPCLVFLHHPPFDSGVPGFEALRLQDRPALRTVIAAHGDKVAALFSGHCHMTVAATVAGRPAFGMRSLFYQIPQDFVNEKLKGSDTAPPAYGVVLIDGADLTVHSVDFDLTQA